MYKVFDFDEYTSKELEKKLNDYAEDGYVATFTEIKRERGLLSGVCILHQYTEEPVKINSGVVGFM